MKFKNTEQRQRFMNALGTFYANLGGTFGAYRLAADAFQSAKTVKLYEWVKFEDADFQPFEHGFSDLQKLRIAMQLAKRRASDEMADIMNGVGADYVTNTAKDIAEYIKLQDESKLTQATPGQR